MLQTRLAIVILKCMSPLKNYNLLVVEDDPVVKESIKLSLPKHWTMNWLNKKADILGSYHAAFVDMHLTPNMEKADGPEMIRRIRANNPKTEIIAMSGNLNTELMELCLENGASKFLAKPLSTDEIVENLEKIEAYWQIRNYENFQHNEVYWVGDSSAAVAIQKKIAELKNSKGPLLIAGDTGTGKEVVFNLLNRQELNRHAITVNLASVPDNLFESEFFGHTKGAFTGAESLKVGLLEAAHGGDLFLDEIEAMPLNQQPKLLRFLETGEVRKVGAKDSTIVSTRVIAATNKNLKQMCEEGLFREDLYFRISGVKIDLPKLNDRIEDIDRLIPYFLKKLGGSGKKYFLPEAVNLLKNYHWTGNVRELKRVIEQLVLTTPLPAIRAVDVEPILSYQEKSSFHGLLQSKMTLEQAGNEFEKFFLTSKIKQLKTVELICESLQISKSNFYKKLKDHHLELE